MSWVYMIIKVAQIDASANAMKDETKLKNRALAWQGKREMAAAEAAAWRRAKNARALTARQVAGYGGNGLELAGTPENTIYNDALQGRMDVMLIEREAKERYKMREYERRMNRANMKAERFNMALSDMFSMGSSVNSFGGAGAGGAGASGGSGYQDAGWVGFGASR